MIDPVEFGKMMGAIVREATAPLIERIAQLEKALQDQPSVDAIAEAAAARVPTPAGADMGALKQHLADLVKAMPAAEVPQALTVEDLRPLVAELVSATVKAMPVAEPGKDADMDALRGHLDELVKSIQLPAVPTIDEVAATFERRFSDLSLSWERQARETFDKAADRMPVPKNGRDALAVETFDMVIGEDGRTVTVKLQAGDTLIEKSVKIPTVIDRGVYSAASAYEKGDGVSYGGCFWIAKCDEPKGVPGSGETDWRRAVNRGRDGKDLRDNASRHDPSKGVPIK